MSDTDGQDEQLLAWDAIARHPFFRDCYATEGPLLTAMLAKLSADPRKVEWAVQYETIGGLPATGYNEFRDRASCERFMANPPLWFDSSWMTNIGIVSRIAATEWAPFTSEATQ